MHLGVLGRILHPHAAVAVGARVVREQVLVRRVVLVDQEAVREVEADAAERVGFARRLGDVHAAVAVVLDLEAHARQHGRILLQRRQIFVVHDRRRHVPGRVDGDVLHRLGQQRRRACPACRPRPGWSRAAAPFLHHPQREVRDVDHRHSALPRSRGYQRQRSMLAMMMSICWLVARAVELLDGPGGRAARWPAGRCAFWNFFTASASACRRYFSRRRPRRRAARAAAARAHPPSGALVARA